MHSDINTQMSAVLDANMPMQNRLDAFHMNKITEVIVNHSFIQNHSFTAFCISSNIYLCIFQKHISIMELKKIFTKLLFPVMTCVLVIILVSVANYDVINYNSSHLKRNSSKQIGTETERCKQNFFYSSYFMLVLEKY